MAEANGFGLSQILYLSPVTNKLNISISDYFAFIHISENQKPLKKNKLEFEFPASEFFYTHQHLKNWERI
ncbi:hypothetical protein [Marinifilum sp.]|uniref:hypothetical protein n=1 Tax=Marinifilum sp. TaxID=2033137 RepID=UPI003BA8B7CD